MVVVMLEVPVTEGVEERVTLLLGVALEVPVGVVVRLGVPVELEVGVPV